MFLKNNDDENEKKYIYKIIYLIYLFVYCPKVNRMLFKVENMHIENSLFVVCLYGGGRGGVYSHCAINEEDEYQSVRISPVTIL